MTVTTQEPEAISRLPAAPRWVLSLLPPARRLLRLTRPLLVLDAARLLDWRVTPWVGPLPILLVAAFAGWELLGVVNTLFEAAAPETSQITSSTHLIGACQFLLHIPVFLIPLLLLRGRVLPLDFLLAVGLAAFANDRGAFDIHLHAFLDRGNPWGIDFYPQFLRPENPNKQIIPQYAKLILFALELLALILVMAGRILRRRLWLDHAFVLLITGVVLTTTLLYHQTVVDVLLEDSQTLHMDVIEQVSELDLRARRAFCAGMKFDCFAGDLAQPFDGHPQDQINAEVRTLQEFARTDPGQTRHGWHSAASLVSTELRGYQIYFREIGERYLVVIDNARYRHAVDRHQAIFSILTMAAHFVWIFGGIGLLIFHRWRFAERARRRAAAAEPRPAL